MSHVVDCSITLPWFLEDERTRFTDQILNAIHQVEYWVPAVWRLEMLNGLLMAERRKRIDRAWRIASVDQASRTLTVTVSGNALPGDKANRKQRAMAPRPRRRSPSTSGSSTSAAASRPKT